MVIFLLNCTCFKKEDMTKIVSNNQQYDICRSCHDKILSEKDNFKNVQTLKQHINRKLQLVMEKQSVYKQLMQDYCKLQKSINYMISKMVDQLKVDINNMDQIIQNQQYISQELSQSEYVSSNINVIPEDLKKLEKQLLIFEEKFRQLTDLLQNFPQLEELQTCQDILKNQHLKVYFKNYKSYDKVKKLCFNSQVVDVQICLQTDTLAISFEDNSLQIFDSFRVFKQCDFLNDCVISAICITDMENIDLMIGDSNGFIQLFQFLFENNKDTEIQLNTINKFKIHQDKIIVIVQKNKNQAISGSLDNYIIVFETEKGNSLVKIPFQLTIMINIAYNKWNKLLAAPSGQEISIWESENISIQQQIKQASLIDQEIQLQFSFDGSVLISSLCREGKLQIYGMDQNKKNFFKTNTINFNSNIFNFTSKWNGPQLVVVTESEILVIEYLNDEYQVLNKIEQTCVKYMPSIQQQDFKLIFSYIGNCLFIYKNN
ncbi:hypothetical protein pb186bvf_015111 [Paramecium bursaria]